MNKFVLFLKWQFVPHGIVVVEETGRISFLAALGRMFSGGVRRDPHGPTAQEHSNVLRVFRRPLKRYKCKICDVHFWSWKHRETCFRWPCFRQVGK